MKDEIKEKIKAYYMDNDIDEVLDYITNLQQKNENAIELCKSLIIFWKKYTNDNSLEVGQLENIIGQLNGDDEE